MVRFGAHAFVWVGDWTTETGNHAIAEAGRLGFDFIEIPLLRPKQFDAASHKAALKKAGIDSVCSITLPRELHLPEAPEKARDYLISLFDVLEAIECNTLGGCIAYTLGYLTGKPPTPAELQTVVDVLKEVCTEGKKRGITLMLEACNRYETYLYNTLEDARKVVQAVGTGNLWVHADTYHMNIEEEGFFKPFVEAADVVRYVHMSESHRGLVGTGTVKWDDVFQGLVAAKFDGSLALESFAGINPDLGTATCLWRPTNAPPDVLAGEGIRFLKAGAQKYGLV